MSGFQGLDSLEVSGGERESIFFKTHNHKNKIFKLPNTQPSIRFGRHILSYPFHATYFIIAFYALKTSSWTRIRVAKV